MVKIAEHYSRARNTSNLKVQPRTAMSASDVLGAAGMAAQQHEEAMLMWGIMYGGNNSQIRALTSTLAARVRKYIIINRLKSRPEKIAESVVAHYLFAQCQACGGVGYQLVPNTIARSDDPCEECGGTGKPREPQDEAWQWLHSYVAQLLSTAAGRVLEKIDLDF